MLTVLRPGVVHPLVEIWEEFLLGYGFYNTEVDTIFNHDSVCSTKLFQEEHGLTADGWVGNQTWGKAIELGLDVLEERGEEKTGKNWPPRPAFGPTSYLTRGQLFGSIQYVPAPAASNPEAIRITNRWQERSIKVVEVPQLAKIPGIVHQGKRVGQGPESGQVALHAKVAEPMRQLWQAWEDEGLLPLVLTWAGMWVPRFVRGSRTTLSNHAYGSAFDINAPWNGLRRMPALYGKKGSVRALVPIANELGWFWGGHFTRRDGMHFEWTSR